jgi:hypothetical protein
LRLLSVEGMPKHQTRLQGTRSLGFKNVKLLYIAHNFGEDWVGKNYPVDKGR